MKKSTRPAEAAGDWREEALGLMRALILEADPKIAAVAGNASRVKKR